MFTVNSLGTATLLDDCTYDPDITGPYLAAALGKAMFGATLDYQYSWLAVAIWFGGMLVIAAAASLMPASSATRISVRESLAYE